MQYRQHNPRLGKTLYHASFLAYYVFIMPSSSTKEHAFRYVMLVMLRSLHAVSLRARHAIRSYLLNIMGFLYSFIYKTAAEPYAVMKRYVIFQSLHDFLEHSQCHSAAAEGAKLSRMRRGNALLAVNGVSDRV